MTKIEKILAFIDNQGITNAAFERKAGLSNGYIGNMVKTNSEVSPKMWEKIVKEIPDIENVIEGSKIGNRKPFRSEAFDLGSFDTDEVTDSSKSGNEFIDIGHGKYVMIVPTVQEYAYGGYITGFQDPTYIEKLDKSSVVVDSMHRGTYRAFAVRGDSMNGGDDPIKEGDVVVGRVIKQELWKSRFHIHKYKKYIIVHLEGILVKEIIDHNVEEGIITCHSTNPDRTRYSDFNIDLSEVRQMLNITNVIKTL